jgi:hypothetical protein
MSEDSIKIRSVRFFLVVVAVSALSVLVKQAIGITYSEFPGWSGAIVGVCALGTIVSLNILIRKGKLRWLQKES